MAGFEILIPNYDEVIQAANLDAELRKAGREIGGSDVWIATAALQRKLPVLTANVDHFTRIDGLTVMGYQVLS